jgi:hypothetical protein
LKVKEFEMLPVLDVIPMREFDTVAGGTAAFGVVDTKGYDYAKIIYLTGKATAASSQDACNVYEDDTLTTAVSNATEIDGCDGTADFTLIAESTTFSNAYVYNVDLRGRKRYISFSYESDATHYGSMVALLGRKADGTEATIATTAHGARNIVSV